MAARGRGMRGRALLCGRARRAAGPGGELAVDTEHIGAGNVHHQRESRALRPGAEQLRYDRHAYHRRKRQRGARAAQRLRVLAGTAVPRGVPLGQPLCTGESPRARRSGRGLLLRRRRGERQPAVSLAVRCAAGRQYRRYGQPVHLGGRSAEPVYTGRAAQRRGLRASQRQHLEQSRRHARSGRLRRLVRQPVVRAARQPDPHLRLDARGQRDEHEVHE